MERCKNCHFFRSDEYGSNGECCFNPPVVVVDTPGDYHDYDNEPYSCITKTVFPDVSANSWCGKWQPKR